MERVTTIHYEESYELATDGYLPSRWRSGRSTRAAHAASLCRAPGWRWKACSTWCHRSAAHMASMPGCRLVSSQNQPGSTKSLIDCGTGETLVSAVSPPLSMSAPRGGVVRANPLAAARACAGRGRAGGVVVGGLVSAGALVGAAAGRT